jgi:hypothetical protein
MRKYIWVSMAVTIMILSGCSSSEKRVSDSDFGDEWPFTVDNGTVECLGDPYVIIFRSNGRTYALNDAARATEQYEDISVIVRTDDNYPGGQVKMDLSIIEFEGLKLCARVK